MSEKWAFESECLSNGNVLFGNVLFGFREQNPLFRKRLDPFQEGGFSSQS